MADKSIKLVTRRLVYDKVGAPPLPIGSEITVSEAQARHWIHAGVARRADSDPEEVPTVAANVDRTIAPPPPNAPFMTVPGEVQSGPVTQGNSK